jgi:UDP-N-acetylmuramoyl-tripeptide--D-alanyl-D-alanine ligase
VAESSLLMTVARLLEAVDGECLGNFSPDHGFSSVATDSRNVVPGSLFVPLIGEFQDGHTYIPKALDAGASVVFVDRAHGDGSATVFASLGKQHDAVFIMVENTLKALQDAARAYVALFPDLVRIGITGSSGKTTTKEIAGSLFAERYNVIMNEGNLNSETGLPLSVFRIRKQHEVGIFELGMNRKGEIAEIAHVLSPSMALITNIGTAHIGILGTQQAIAEEKKQIFSYFDGHGTGFVPEDDEYRAFLSDIPNGRVLPFGPATTCGFEGSEDLGIDGSRVRYEGLEMRLPLPGTYNLKNALGAIALARYAGLTPAEIKAGIEKVKPLFGRAEVIHGKITVLLDCYNANPDSMESALDFCSNLEWTGKKIFVLGSMLELGAESEAAHRRICRIAAGSGVETVFLFGDDMVKAGASTDWGSVSVHSFTDIAGLSHALSSSAVEGDLVFLKGSRGMALERVCPALGLAGYAGVSHG